MPENDPLSLTSRVLVYHYHMMALVAQSVDIISGISIKAVFSILRISQQLEMKAFLNSSFLVALMLYLTTHFASSTAFPIKGQNIALRSPGGELFRYLLVRYDSSH